MITVAFVIINYNGNEDTLACLQSLDRHCFEQGLIQYKTILVDNASKHPLQTSDLSRFCIPIHYYMSSENLGFAGGNNYGMKAFLNEGNTTDYFLLLNNDTEVVDDSISRLVLETEKSCYSITGVVNYYFDQPKEVWQAGSIFRERRLRSIELKPSGTSSFIEADNVPGSSLLVKREVVDKIGMLDERFFAYYEEVEFCARAKKAGYRIAFLDSTRLLHKVGRSSTSLFKHYLRTRNTLLLYSLHYNKYMCTAWCRVFLRTLLCCKSDLIGIWRSYRKGIKDFRNQCFYIGTF